MRMEGVGGARVTVKYKYDETLFRRYTRNASERRVTECQFADDSALLATTTSGAEISAIDCQQTSTEFGLIVSLPKTKQMVMDMMVEEGDQECVALDGGSVEVVDKFPYFGSLIEDTGRIDADMNRREAQTLVL